jgi:hypothetical protein
MSSVCKAEAGPMTICTAEGQKWVKCLDGKGKEHDPDGRCIHATRRCDCWQCYNLEVHKKLYPVEP